MKDWKNMHYEDVFRNLKGERCAFSCSGDCEFLDSLQQDGYDEWCMTRPSDKIKTCSGQTSCAETGAIFFAELDKYFEISVCHESANLYLVEVSTRDILAT